MSLVAIEEPGERIVCLVAVGDNHDRWFARTQRADRQPPSHAFTRLVARTIPMQRSLRAMLSLLFVAFAASLPAQTHQTQAHQTQAQQNFNAWQHRGVITVLTTPEGADLPAGVVLEHFPLLVRLHQECFDFAQAMPHGEDLRFSRDGTALAHEIEHWDAANGTASIWVRLPKIEGNARQDLHVHWGNANAVSTSNGKAVFDASNGHVSVWHLGSEVVDAVGTLASQDQGTTVVPGMIGEARHFPGGHGIFCGDQIANYPAKDHAHTTSLWFRAAAPNGTVIGWGNEGGGRGSKIRMQFRSPPHIYIDSDFSDVKAESRLPLHEWIHVVHTYGNGPRKLYINGKLDGEATTQLDIKSPSRLWLGGWYHHYDFVGDLDEVRIADVTRTPEWIRLQFENQKPLQTLVGPVVQPGSQLVVSPAQATVMEGERAWFEAQAGGAQKLYWSVLRAGQEALVAVDRLRLPFEAGRVTADEPVTLRLRAIYPNEVKVLDIPITIQEAIAEPAFILRAPAKWDGRATIEVVPEFTRGDGELHIDWQVANLAVIQKVAADRLVLSRAQNSGTLMVTATVSNGGQATTGSVAIEVAAPLHDAWIARTPDLLEQPQDGQFYARDATGEGTLHCNGKLVVPAPEVFLKVYAEDQLVATETGTPTADGSYQLTTKLAAGLWHYRIEFGTKTDGQETVLHTAKDIVCGDAYLIDGQSNALATDTGEDAPRETHEWIRSYARARHYRAGETQNLWCRPVWKAQAQHTAELGWWGMELAKSLVASQQVPIFMINGAVGGTRIDQHQRNEQNPTDLQTIYGELLWRVQQARLTHGIRAILWHQGENDQGAAGPDGGYGWETYQRYFVSMSAAWQQDFPNVRHFYVFQIWPNACSMGNGNGDMLREVQRTLPRLYANLDVLATVGIEPPGPCHFPLQGWRELAQLLQPLIERDFYGKQVTTPITAPNLVQASFVSASRNEIRLQFDQPVVWHDALRSEFYLDGKRADIVLGNVSGNTLTLELRAPSTAQSLAYLHEKSWSQQRLLRGQNGLAALTFCNVPIGATN